ncbi:hypothetical protein [Hydrogenophaga sp. 2FB]|uniref:hypothetical protein n=1 Tax=Hydrogenophaga sp. 2FB TaxID=2502187 RepID=UPI0010F827CB|nr:hypothetical protein [Hydrogenophaga sp. 2FB]
MNHRLALMACVGLAACQPAPDDDSWFPLVEGTVQVYAVKVESDEPTAPEEWTLTVQGPQTVDNKTLMVRHHSAGVSYYLHSDEHGVRRIATRTDIDNEPTTDPEPLWVLKAPYQVGTEWTTPTVPYLVLRRNEHPRELRYTHKALMGWRIEAVNDEVTTPTGTHKPCLRVVGRAKLNLFTDPVNGFTDVPLTSREWYCKGKGLVKFEREETVPSGFLVGGRLMAEWSR